MLIRVYPCSSVAICLSGPLEQKLQAELNAPRAFRRLNFAERRRAHEIVGQIQIHAIQQIECFGAELQARALAPSGGLDDGNVDVLKSRTRQYVPPGIDRKS